MRGSTNDVDGTWGNYTIQEGEDDLFLINRRNGKNKVQPYGGQLIMAINFPEGTQDFPASIVQVKAHMTNSVGQFGSDVIYGGGNNGASA